MNVLIIVLNQTEFLDDILDSFVEIGIKGATILDSQGMGSAISHSNIHDDRIFRSLKTLITDSRPYNKTIFTVIEGEYLTQQAMKKVKEIVGDMNKPGVGLMFTVPVGHIFGM